jgi:hypothetical protein
MEGHQKEAYVKKDDGFLQETFCFKLILTKDTFMSVKKCFDIACLESVELQRLFHEMTSYVQNIRIELMAGARGHRSCEEHPAATIGLTLQKRWQKQTRKAPFHSCKDESSKEPSKGEVCF